MSSSLSEATDLSTEIIGDIELSRLPKTQILMKCRRLARLVSDESWSEWLTLETQTGYNFAKLASATIKEETWFFYFQFFGREFDPKTHTGLVHPISVLERELHAAEVELSGCKIPATIQASSAQSFLPDSAQGAINTVLTRTRQLQTIIAQREVIISRVMSLTYSKALKWYVDLRYGSIAQSIFERRRKEVDGRLDLISREALEQLVSAYDRLRSDSEEEWAQALLSCRRILKSFADSVYPPSNSPYEASNKKKYSVVDDKYINRLIAFIDQNRDRVKSTALLASETELIGNYIDKIYEIASKGVHAKISRNEADSAVIRTYLLLSDLIEMAPPKTTDLPQT